jgi:class 3 adenylate cyclase
MPEDRRLAAIMFTDIVGYTTLMGRDEYHALEILQKTRNIHQLLINKYHNKLIKEIGDGILISFNSSSDAVRCVLEIQTESKK